MRARWALVGCCGWLLSGACDDSDGPPADGGRPADAWADTASETGAGTLDTAGDRPVDQPADTQSSDLAAETAGGETGPAGPLPAKVDILFVVDNSGSMAEEQANLARNFPLFLKELGATDAQGSDLHIAVVSSDLGAGAGTFNAGCTMGGDQGTFCRTQVSAVAGVDAGTDVCARCGVDTSQGRFLRTRTPNFTGSISDAFSCMARLGTGGCGFEHTLGALASALGAAQNGPFLREDAYLAFVIITDEDDCTAPPDSTLFASAIPGQDISLRCALEGHTCQGHHNDGSIDVNLAVDECQAADDGALRPIGTLVNQVLALKRDPGRIVAAGIFGWPLPGQERSARYLISATGAGLGNRTQRPICQSGNGSAVVGYRVKSFVESFPRHTALSICQDDFRPALQQIADRIRTAVGP